MSDKSNKKNSKIFNKKNEESGTKITFTSKTVSVLLGVELLEYSSYKQDPLKFQRAKESLIAYIGPKYGRNVIILEQDTGIVNYHPFTGIYQSLPG